MTAKLEVLRDFAHWVKVEDLGIEPHEIKGSISKASNKYVIAQDEDGAGSVIFTFSQEKDDLSKTLSNALGQSLLDLETDYVEPGYSVLIEGVLPGNTKPELLRITQE